MINICLVGTGGIATHHMKAFAETGGVHPRWVVSRTEGSAGAFARQWKFDRFGSEMEVALADPAVNLVVITSPSNLHAEQTILALRAGKDVAVEIPVALSLADTKRIIELADKLRRRVFVCHTMRSFPAIREVRRRVQARELHVRQVVGHFAIPRRRNQGMNGQPRSWTDNLLWHHGCHMVDVAMWVLGAENVEDIWAGFGEESGAAGTIMDAVVHFRTSEKQLVTHSLTYNTEQLCWEVRFIGSDKSLTYLNGHLLDEKGEPVLPESSWLDLLPQNRDILKGVQRGAPSDYDVASVLAPMRVLHEAELSAKVLLRRRERSGEGAER